MVLLPCSVQCVQYDTVLGSYKKTTVLRWSFLYTVLDSLGSIDDEYAAGAPVLPIDYNLKREQPHERERVRFGGFVRERVGGGDRLSCGVEENVADGDVDERVEGEGVGLRAIVECGAVNDCRIDNKISRVFAVGSENEIVEFGSNLVCGEFSDVLVFERDT